MRQLGEPTTPPEYLAAPGELPVSLRLTSTADGPELYKIIENNPSLRQYIYWMNGIHTPEDAQMHVDGIVNHIAEGKGVQYRIVPGPWPNDQPIGGSVGVFKINRNTGFASYWLTEDCQGRGYGRRCVEAVLNYAIPALGLCTVKLYIEKGNERSQKVAKCLSFTHRGSYRDDLGDLAGDGERQRVIQVWRRDYGAD